MSEMKIYKAMGQFFFGYLVTIAIFGTLTPSYLMEPLNLLPPTTKFLFFFSTFIYGMTIFALWQIGYITSEALYFIYRKVRKIATTQEEK